jgi:phosphoglycerate dehydrogenase-like enzyme
VLEAAVDLRVISRNGTGVDSIDAAAAKERNISILRAEGANARGVAELTIGLLFALARSLPGCDASIKAGRWDRPNGLELEGRTLGIIGCGRIGKIVAELAVGVGLNVVAHDAFPDYNFFAGAAFQFVPMHRVLRHADFLSLHCPPPSQGQALIGEPEFAQIKHGSFVINTARYQLIDPEALLAALGSGRIAGAALDVFDSEPPRDARLARHPRVLATPHIGGLTKESIGRAMDAAVDNLIRALAVPR